MPSSLPGLIGAAALAAAGLPPAHDAGVVWIPVCHGSALPIRLPAGDDRGRGKTCPGGCHAACAARDDDQDDVSGEG